MSEAEQYEQEQCDSAQSDYSKELMIEAMAEKKAKRQERLMEEFLESQKNGKQ